MLRRFAAVVAAGVLVATGMAAGPAHAATRWVANSPSKILNANTVRLIGGNTSVETANLDMPVQAGDVISFRYHLQGGAECVGGAPRVFVEIQGVYTNSWDQNQPGGTQCGTNGVVTFTVPSNGRIGAAGVVYDNGKPGQVIVSDLRVDGRRVSFLSRPDVPVRADAPTAVQPDCGAERGKVVIPSERGVTYKVRADKHPWHVARAGEYPVRPGVYWVRAEAKDGYRLVGKALWRLTVREAEPCPTPTPTPTDEPPATPTPTEEPSEEPTETPSEEPSETPSEEPAKPAPTVTQTQTITRTVVVNNIPVPSRVDTGFGGLAR